METPIIAVAHSSTKVDQRHHANMKNTARSWGATYNAAKGAFKGKKKKNGKKGEKQEKRMQEFEMKLKRPPFIRSCPAPL